jgi:hypothetical protein
MARSCSVLILFLFQSCSPQQYQGLGWKQNLPAEPVIQAQVQTPKVSVPPENCSAMCGPLNVGCNCDNLVNQPLAIADQTLLGSDGLPLRVRGLNWGGFQNGTGNLEGLMQGTSSLSKDISTVGYRLRLMGFNVIRIKFSFYDLFGKGIRTSTKASGAKPVVPWAASKCTLATSEEIRNSLLPPSSFTQYKKSDVPLPPQPFSLTSRNVSETEQCGVLFENKSILHRFLTTLNFFARNNFAIILSDDLSTHYGDLLPIIDPDGWVSAWSDLVALINRDVPTRNMVMFEPLSDPSIFKFNWDQEAEAPMLQNLPVTDFTQMLPYLPPEMNSKTGKTMLSSLNQTPAAGSNLLLRQKLRPLREMYERMMDAVNQLNPNALFVIQGIKPAVFANTSNFGNPTQFFRKMAQKNYRNKIVLGSWMLPNMVPAGKFQESFGQFHDQGFCPQGDICQKYPLIATELGGCGFNAASVDFCDANQLATEVPYFDEVQKFLNGPASSMNLDKRSTRLNWVFSSWIDETGSLGSLQVSNDVTKLRWDKLSYLIDKLDLNPWWDEDVPKFRPDPQTDKPFTPDLTGVNWKEHPLDPVIKIEFNETVIQNINQVVILNTVNETYVAPTNVLSGPPSSTTQTTDNSNHSNNTLVYSPTEITKIDKSNNLTLVNQGQEKQEPQTGGGPNNTASPTARAPVSENNGVSGPVNPTPTTHGGSSPTPNVVASPTPKSLPGVTTEVAGGGAGGAKPKATGTPSTSCESVPVAEGCQFAPGSFSCELTAERNVPWEEPPGSRRFKAAIQLYVKNTSKTHIRAPWSVAVYSDKWIPGSSLRIWNWTDATKVNEDGWVCGTVKAKWADLFESEKSVVNLVGEFTTKATDPMSFLPLRARVCNVECKVVQR